MNNWTKSSLYSIQFVEKIVSQLKINKAASLDGLTVEHIGNYRKPDNILNIWVTVVCLFQKLTLSLVVRWNLVLNKEWLQVQLICHLIIVRSGKYCVGSDSRISVSKPICSFDLILRRLIGFDKAKFFQSLNSLLGRLGSAQLESFVLFLVCSCVELDRMSFIKYV